MIRFFKKCFLLIFLITFSVNLYADVQQNGISFQYLVDTDHRSVDEIMHVKDWKTYKRDLFYIKSKTKAVWIKLNQSLLSKHTEEFLQINSESMIIFDIYKIKNSSVVSIDKFGKLNSQISPSLLKSELLISLKDKPDEIYLKLLQIPTISISFDFIDTSDTIILTEKNVFINGLFFGILAFLFLYNFILYINTKFTPYIPYLLYILGVIFYFLITDTFYLQSWWIFKQGNMMVWFHIAMTISLVGMLWLPISLLNLYTHYTKFTQFVLVAIFMIIVFESLQLLLIHFEKFDLYSILFDLESLIIVMSSFSLLIMSYILASKGNKLALYYSIAWSVLFIALINYVIQNNFFETDKLVTKNYFRLAIVIEGLLFSFILAFRIRELRKLKEAHHQVLVEKRHNEQITSMLNEVAHQWRQPLNTINAIIFENTLQDKVPDKMKWKTTLNEIEDLTSFLSSTIDDFQQNYLCSENDEDFLIKEVCNQALYILSRKLKEHNVQYECNIDETVALQGSSRYFMQVLLIFLNNAIEAFPPEQKEKRIFISSKNDDRYIIISVEDNAGGMDASLFNKIFKYHISKKEGHQGLGLSLAKKIINESFHGNLELINTPKGLQCLIKVSKNEQ